MYRSHFGSRTTHSPNTSPPPAFFTMVNSYLCAVCRGLVDVAVRLCFSADCGICLQTIDGSCTKEVLATECGHAYCEDCLRTACEHQNAKFPKILVRKEPNPPRPPFDLNALPWEALTPRRVRPVHPLLTIRTIHDWDNLPTPPPIFPWSGYNEPSEDSDNSSRSAPSTSPWAMSPTLPDSFPAEGTMVWRTSHLFTGHSLYENSSQDALLVQQYEVPMAPVGYTAEWRWDSWRPHSRWILVQTQDES